MGRNWFVRKKKSDDEDVKVEFSVILLFPGMELIVGVYVWNHLSNSGLASIAKSNYGLTIETELVEDEEGDADLSKQKPIEDEGCFQPSIKSWCSSPDSHPNLYSLTLLSHFTSLFPPESKMVRRTSQRMTGDTTTKGGKNNPPPRGGVIKQIVKDIVNSCGGGNKDIN
ncbi:hypothetical protein L6452_24681 [Arctium lappa]|uniref:Uncharacterized protein n=1 Tax=Arctium lappa TaxID=4217 RepID=A0ACB9A9E2_ARCLA|nr:hypothetical protein L6452_24681 [Arctium lappa]